MLHASQVIAVDVCSVEDVHMRCKPTLALHTFIVVSAVADVKTERSSPPPH